jgi:arylsulfatase A
MRQMFTAAFAALLLPFSVTSSPKPPNIIVILADDLGVGDIQAHYPDNKIATPYLDKLVREGMSFTDAHSPSAVCSPTRYGLLTGRYAWRTRLQEWVVAAYEPPLIDQARVTLPGFLRDQGYHTACIGKWHLGWDWPGPQKSRMTEAPNGQKNLTWHFTKPIAGGPIDRGFDYFYGVDLPNLPPFTYIENDRIALQPTAKYVHDPTEGVVMPRGFIGAPMAPGWKFADIMPEITRRAVEQVHQLAKQNKPFFLYFSQTSPHEPVVPSKRFKGKSGIAPIADFVMETDWSAGQVIKAVDDAGIAENTIVIFTADNGHSHYTGWPDLIKAGHLPSGPYRGHKGDIWEGGHRVPLILRWKGQIPGDHTSNQLVSLTDLLATFADLIGKPLPKNGAEDSISFLSTLIGDIRDPLRTTVINHSNHGEFSYRDGNWKLVFRNALPNRNKSRGKQRIVELYDLKNDIAETKDLAKAKPKRVAELTAKFAKQVSSGATRPGSKSVNDTTVRFTHTQTQRWGPLNPR